MAGDWIKMRTDLHLDSKVDAMAEFLASKPAFAAWALDPSQGGKRLQDVLSPAAYVAVTRSAVVTGLLVTWGVTRRDGVVDGDDLIVSPQTLDTITRNCGIPHMGEAMALVGWALFENGNAVRYPKALINLTSPEERKREQDAERKRRQRDRERDKSGGVSRAESHQCHATVTPRVEESREEEKQSAARALEASPPTPTPPPEAAPAGKLTASDYVKLLGPHGIATNVFDQVLIGWALSEIPAARIEEAIVIAKRRKGDERIHTRYLDPIVRDPTSTTSPAPASKSGKDQADAKLARTAAQVAEQARWEAAPMPDSIRGFVHKAGSA